MPSSALQTSDQAQGTRDRLVMAALELFAQKGYEATGLKEVLTKAGANRRYGQMLWMGA